MADVEVIRIQNEWRLRCNDCDWVVYYDATIARDTPQVRESLAKRAALHYCHKKGPLCES